MSQPNVYLDPLNQALAEQLATQPPLQDLTIEQFRALLHQIQQHDPIPGVTRTQFSVPFEDGVDAFVFKPDGAKGVLPTMFYLHGGGWVSGEYALYAFSLVDAMLTIVQCKRLRQYLPHSTPTN